LIPGAIVVYLLKTLLLKDAREENNRLVEAVRNAIGAH
jgi:hypothetical protein